MVKKKLPKIFLTIFIVASFFWLGTSNVRAIVGNQLLDFGTAEFKQNLNPFVEREYYDVVALCSSIMLGGYVFVLVGAIGFISTTELSFKNHGWLLICTILFFIFVPVEIYTLTLDWKIIGLNYWGDWPIEEFRKIFLKRLTALSGAPFLATLTYYSIIVIAIWQPLKTTSQQE